jgi:hypothetical protein
MIHPIPKPARPDTPESAQVHVHQLHRAGPLRPYAHPRTRGSAPTPPLFPSGIKKLTPSPRMRPPSVSTMI